MHIVSMETFYDLPNDIIFSKSNEPTILLQKIKLSKNLLEYTDIITNNVHHEILPPNTKFIIYEANDLLRIKECVNNAFAQLKDIDVLIESFNHTIDHLEKTLDKLDSIDKLDKI